MSTRLTTDTELADMLGVTVDLVRLKCRHEWPSVRPKRGVWRFTEAQVQSIIDMQTTTPGRRRAPVSTQTRRSAARSA